MALLGWIADLDYAAGPSTVVAAPSVNITVTYAEGNVYFPRTRDDPVRFPRTYAESDINFPRTRDEPVRLA